ncbi:MAG TPA: hypothetical protein VJT49_09075 [Amycolatopsis sp.]|uniref:hypothetical protein n=1 Tax=Amycolatopsis sp. TaxID=37632 RepID=UPI002B48250D|nr:hypothetical protein [Amycolatopsis sp.]HKS45253.1 hypothetical protein [Amycolatopsis sp.]
MIDSVRQALCITGSDHLQLGGSLPAIAAHLVREVCELRERGEFPARASVQIDIGPEEALLDILITGLSPDNDPDRIETVTAMRTVFELASHANVIDITGAVAPLFTNRILAVDEQGVPYAGLIGAGMGDIHPGEVSCRRMPPR